MAAPSTHISPDLLEELAYRYLDECENNMNKERMGNRVVEIKKRHVPTIQYFLRIWIPKQPEAKDENGEGKPFNRSTYYAWLNYNVPSSIDLDLIKDDKERQKIETHRKKSDTIKKIEEVFKALAVDIVANEDRAIFYAKNKLGMSDRFTHMGDEIQPLFPPLSQ